MVFWPSYQTLQELVLGAFHFPSHCSAVLVPVPRKFWGTNIQKSLKRTPAHYCFLVKSVRHCNYYTPSPHNKNQQHQATSKYFTARISAKKKASGQGHGQGYALHRSHTASPKPGRRGEPPPQAPCAAMPPLGRSAAPSTRLVDGGAHQANLLALATRGCSLWAFGRPFGGQPCPLAPQRSETVKWPYLGLEARIAIPRALCPTASLSFGGFHASEWPKRTRRSPYWPPCPGRGVIYQTPQRTIKHA